ncbi:hypothetical protein LTR36_004806 [Oleoguttula mirabilis]|uniref:Uncharacterized protein n=1 Tax=Oleoguttula mirabilis TaxID=1507867 RepID=A0AAV9JFH0_9PEZI|nr:hypothetical protein LTR36_004806 [Oleoguttula mirabilis]
MIIKHPILDDKTLSPYQRVFGVAETMEMVFLCLDPGSLLQLRRTTNKFREAIDNTVSLMRNTFRDQDADPRLGRPTSPDNNQVRTYIYDACNGMQTNTFFRVGLNGGWHRRAYDLTNSGKRRPVFTYDIEAANGGSGRFKCHIPSEMHLPEVCGTGIESYSGMYLTQPPIDTIGHVTYTISLPRESSPSRFERLACRVLKTKVRSYDLVGREATFQLGATSATLGNMLKAANNLVMADQDTWKGKDGKKKQLLTAVKSKRTAVGRWFSKTR